MELIVTYKHGMFRSSFTCSYNPKRFEETPQNRESLTRIP